MVVTDSFSCLATSACSHHLEQRNYPYIFGHKQRLLFDFNSNWLPHFWFTKKYFAMVQKYAYCKPKNTDMDENITYHEFTMQFNPSADYRHQWVRIIHFTERYVGQKSFRSKEKENISSTMARFPL